MPLMYDFHHIHSFPSFTEEGSAPQTGGNDSPKVTDIEEKETMTIKAEQTFPHVRAFPHAALQDRPPGLRFQLHS